MIEVRQHERIASRRGAVLLVIFIALMIGVLPERYRMVPAWLAYLQAVVMIVPMVVVSLSKGRVWRRIEPVVEVLSVASAFVFNTSNLLVVAYNMVENPGALEPVALFYTSIAIWSSNVLVFTLIYWLIDGGGPDARLNGRAIYPDFDFPARDEGAPIRPGWQPAIVDYLFLAFTTNTAFSPTEAMPMTGRAKVLVMVQSSIALVTIAVVAARTINILK